MHEGPRALAVVVGDLGKAFIDQLARAGAAGVEIGGEGGEGRGIGIRFSVMPLSAIRLSGRIDAGQVRA